MGQIIPTLTVIMFKIRANYAINDANNTDNYINYGKIDTNYDNINTNYTEIGTN